MKKRNIKKVLSASTLLLATTVSFVNTDIKLPLVYQVKASDPFDLIFDDVDPNFAIKHEYISTDFEVGKTAWFVIENPTGSKTFFKDVITVDNVDKLKSKNALLFHFMYENTPRLELTKDNIMNLGGIKEDDIVVLVNQNMIDATVNSFNNFKQEIADYQKTAADTFLYLGDNSKNVPILYYYADVALKNKPGETVDLSVSVWIGDDARRHLFLQKSAEMDNKLCMLDDGNETIEICSDLTVPGPYFRRAPLAPRDLPQELKIEWKDGNIPQPIGKDEVLHLEYRAYYDLMGEKIYLTDYKPIHYYGSTKLYDKKNDNFSGRWTINPGYLTPDQYETADDWDFNNHTVGLDETTLKTRVNHFLFTNGSVYSVVEKGLVKVNHVDKSGKILKPSTTQYGSVGENYLTSPAKIDKYKVVNDKPNNYEGSFIKGTIEVTYVYDKLPEPIVPSSPTPKPSLPPTGTNNKIQTFSLISLVSALLLFIGYKKNK